MTREEELKIIEGVQIEIAKAIAREKIRTVFYNLYMPPSEKLKKVKEIAEEIQRTIEKIKSNGRAI